MEQLDIYGEGHDLGTVQAEAHARTDDLGRISGPIQDRMTGARPDSVGGASKEVPHEDPASGAPPTFTRLPDVDLPHWHPAAPTRPRAYQCDTCHGIFYPTGEPTSCPYCEDDDE